MQCGQDGQCFCLACSDQTVRCHDSHQERVAMNHNVQEEAQHSIACDPFLTEAFASLSVSPVALIEIPWKRPSRTHQVSSPAARTQNRQHLRGAGHSCITFETTTFETNSATRALPSYRFNAIIECHGDRHDLASTCAGNHLEIKALLSQATARPEVSGACTSSTKRQACLRSSV